MSPDAVYCADFNSAMSWVSCVALFEYPVFRGFCMSRGLWLNQSMKGSFVLLQTDSSSVV